MDLKPVGIFEGMSPGELKKAAKSMREIRHPQGAEIMIRGEGGVGFLVILDGEAEVATPDGRHRRLGPGDHFGEMALLDHQGRSASVTAHTDLVAAAVPEWGFKPFLQDHPEVTYRLLETMSRRLREAEAGKS
ncbi:MAG: cyclic nucleotide-binding domain-containing protein [Chloroflexi bacterium]|nr:MAG: cyclic nucleotide-binding domain-containing protein [Chloroflexota bacterium]